MEQRMKGCVKRVAFRGSEEVGLGCWYIVFVNGNKQYCHSQEYGIALRDDL